MTKIVPIKYDPRHPVALRGRRLGSWTNKLHKPMWLCEVTHRDGKSQLQWIKANKVGDVSRRPGPGSRKSSTRC
jgi:hypothetical protein